MARTVPPACLHSALDTCPCLHTAPPWSLAAACAPLYSTYSTQVISLGPPLSHEGTGYGASTAPSGVYEVAGTWLAWWSGGAMGRVFCLRGHIVGIKCDYLSGSFWG
ncbi:hypothetical protein EDC01DRAFT_633267 [Geopyxis carbonaria]|nr:hypothetical protein EDC01DRAFT_633267 [Geopyxis carbonaria]